jgi:hypothetical protein
MTDYVRKSEKGGNSVYFEVGVWYNKDSGHIHMTAPNSGWFHTTINDNEGSKRGHPNLYGKLARALKEAGAPGPEIDETKMAEEAQELS